MLKLIIYISITAVFLIKPPLSFADLAFKRKVIENCTEAKADINRLEKAQQIESIEDLKLVLKLNLMTPNNDSLNLGKNLNKLPSINNPLDNVKGGEFWQTFQPDREIKAKICALEILASLSPYSIEALPEMIELSDNHTLPHDLQNLLHQSIKNIIIDSANDIHFTVPDKIVDQLIEMLDKPYAFYAQNALIELQKISLPKLFEKMVNPDPKLRDLLTSLLLRIDHTGDIIGTDLIKFLDSADDGLKKRAISLLSELEGFYAFSLPPLIKKLFDISPEIQESAFDALNKIFLSLKNIPAITLDPESIDNLLKKFLASHGKKREILSLGLNKLLTFNDTYEKKIIDAFKTEDANLKSDILNIFRNYPKVSANVKSLLFNAVKDRNAFVRLKALQIINFAKITNNQSNQALIKLLDDTNQEISSSAGREIISLDKAIAPDFLKYFKSKNLNEKMGLLEIALKIAPSDKDVKQVFESNLKKLSCEEKVRIFSTHITLENKLRLSALKEICACFADKESEFASLSDSLAAQFPFPAQEKEIIDTIYKQNDLSLIAMNYLLLNSKKLETPKDEIISMLKKLLASSDKSIKFRALNYINSSDLSGLASEDLLAFQRENSNDDLLSNEAVLAISKIPGSSFDVEGFFVSQIDSSDYQWTEKYIDRLDPGIAVSIINKSLEKLAVSKKYIPIRMAGQFGKSAEGLLPEIKKYLDTPDSNLSYNAEVALIKISPSDPLAEDYLRKLLFRDSASLLLKERFDSAAIQMFDKIRLSTVSVVEKNILKTLTSQAVNGH